MPAPLSAAAASAPSSAKRAYVVDDVCAGGDRGAHHLGLAGVHRNEHGGLAPQTFNDRDDALELHVEFCGLRAGSRGLATDVDDARAFGDHAPRMRQRRRKIREWRPPSEKESGVTLSTPMTTGDAEIEDPIPALPLGGAYCEQPPAGMN